MNEFRIFGPPGCGKTTFLSRQVSIAADKHGAENILIASYTRAAAAELVSRDLEVPKENIGTLHAICYRAMGQPQIAELNTETFNASNPEFALSSETKVDIDEAVVEQNFEAEGDYLFNEYKMARARMQDLNEASPRCKQFIKAWESWKVTNGLVDFTDMIAHTIQAGGPPPGGQTIGFYDEAQDFNRMELTLLRQWAEHQDHVLLAGDDDQCLYSFVGATPHAFLNPPIPADHKRVLSQSWRVPRVIKNHATKWIEQIKIREPKEYKARDFEGELRQINATFKMPHRVIDDAMRQVSDKKTVMFLTTCGYMLNGLRSLLREEGIPYHNPYRKTRGDWNPLGASTKRRTSARDRLLAFLSKEGQEIDGKIYWPIETLSKWIAILKSKGILTKKAKEKVSDQKEFPTVYTPEEFLAFYESLFEGSALADALSRNLDWFEESLLSAKKDTMEFPIKIFKRHGYDALMATPRVIVSTIHGVKGGEADVVYLFPDLSLAGMREWEQVGEGKESIIRTFYVGMTRARESLVLCSPATRLSIRIGG